ncbi:glycoside hydrolase family 15 protein [Cucurbitaria berberidis CBS 394.84]|uniref:Glycoside hydrolase family 15 protein n=1 Tax=Cucurbitaria berberidis CBS 394.84 TaxID=1168544 RepID=A0A9P4GN02_9PLEO|nr:glycoside hydrolase family 15 protein [Cucurbitaria berberidis CBS 394.84]KAF1848550.1 glycoside hydrolase family 15 protein [Cucurbitaria berberidis CBS 394.84]
MALDRNSSTKLHRQHSKKSKEEEIQNAKMERSELGVQRSGSRRAANGYLPIEDYGLIGNMRTCAMVGTDGGIDYMCWPYFDSPSVFCRILDKDKGGHFTISPISDNLCTTKQQYLPASNILQTRYLKEEGVMNVVDFFPRPNNRTLDNEYHANVTASEHTGNVPERPDLKKWLIRRVECMRGSVDVSVEVFPAFNYAQDKHTTEIADLGKTEHGHPLQRITFRSETLALELNATIDCGDEPDSTCPRIKFEKSTERHALGDGITTSFRLTEGQAVSFILRDAEDHNPDVIETTLVDDLQLSTHKYWARWIQGSKYTGRWNEVVTRSLLLLKMLIFEPSGAIVAAPTFSLPEDFGGERNWDYRYSWIRDASFTIYILLRLGFSHEAEAYTSYIFQRVKEAKARHGALPIMFTRLIWGGTDIPEMELEHLDGYRGSKPVRIGNGAAFHVQLDIYGELMDGIYLVNRFGKPVTYDQWLSVREIADYVCTIWTEKDMSIWEVRGMKLSFVYSKIMLWVALDRALRLADKRSFPCPHRAEWYRVRDEICEEVMEKGYNPELGCFIQSYESRDVLDSAVLIAPLVFFISPTDPRFLKTLDRILKPPEKGGLTSTGLVYRYNHALSDDGVGGREGAFSMCTFWLVEALTRAGEYDEKYLIQAVTFFENMLNFGNHLHIFSEEIARSGEQLGNTPQAFSHLALISAAFNLDKTLNTARRR